MTVTPAGPQSNNLPALPADFHYEGMDQFDVNDAIVPRIKISHRKMAFEDSLAPDDSFSELRCVVLGLVKQRLLWHHKLQEGVKSLPMCQAPAFSTGLPLNDPSIPADRQFPWHLTNFNQTDYPPDSEGQVHLPCAACNLKEWNSHPAGDKPYCSETWTLPIMRSFGDGVYSPAIIAFAKSGLGPLRAFFTSLSTKRMAPFQVETTISLAEHSMGGNVYAKPIFRIGDVTPNGEWQGWATQFSTMKDFIERAPEGASDSTDSVVSAQVVMNDATSGIEDPWAQPITTVVQEPQAAPVQAAPVQTAPVQTAPVQAAPVQAAPVQAAPVQAAPVQAAIEDDDLPF